MNLNDQDIRTNMTTLYQSTIEKYWPRLFKFCCIYLTDEDAAKDITQDVFLSLWEKKDVLAEGNNIIPYLMVACRNRCLNYIRDQQRKFPFETELTDQQLSLKINKYALEDIPSVLLESLDLHKAIKEALSLLRPRTREIFYLRYYEGLDIDEISKKTNLTKKAVQYHLYKAIKVLQKELSPSEFFFVLLLLST